MGGTIEGVVIEKDYLPPPGAPPKYWCYLTVQTDRGDRVKVRVHQRSIDVATVGDRVRVDQPRRKNKRVKVARLG